MAVRYYFNLAPNYAATLTPRVLSKRGLQWQGEFRYLQPKYSGIWSGQYLHNDRKAHFNRWLLDLEHKQRFDFGGDYRSNTAKCQMMITSVIYLPLGLMRPQCGVCVVGLN